jgi:hypothetical protein
VAVMLAMVMCVSAMIVMMMRVACHLERHG